MIARDRLNVINRMPQGSTFIDVQSYPDNCDATHPFRFRIFIPTKVLQLTYGLLSFQLQAFRADSSTSAAGSAHSHSVSGQSASAGTSATSGHVHTLNYTNATPTHAMGLNDLLDLVVAGAAGGTATAQDSPAHSHSIPSLSVSGATSTSEAAHTHPVNFGIFEGSVATGVTVKINGVDRTSALGGGAGFTADQTELAIGQWLTIGAWNTIDLTPTGLGRILGHVAVVGYIQSN